MYFNGEEEGGGGKPTVRNQLGVVFNKKAKKMQNVLKRKNTYVLWWKLLQTIFILACLLHKDLDMKI